MPLLEVLPHINTLRGQLLEAIVAERINVLLQRIELGV